MKISLSLTLFASLVLSVGLLAAVEAAVAQDHLPPPGECPQPRFAGKAPPNIYALRNPLDHDPGAINEGRSLYLAHPAGVACATCHGEKGDGKGEMASQFDPRPRNFTCSQTINGVPDGQLFWIIRNGSPGTAMPPANSITRMTDQQIWQLVSFLRTLAR